MWRIILFIFFVILFRRFSKNLKEQQQQQKQPKQDNINQLFENWGIPLPEETPVKKPQPEISRQRYCLYGDDCQGYGCCAQRTGRDGQGCGPYAG